MSDRKRYNIVRFVETNDDGNATGIVLYLKLEAPYIRKVGMKPDRLSATVPGSEAEKLKTGGSINIARKGSLEFWSTQEPGDAASGGADASFDEMRIIDIEHVELSEDASGKSQVATWRIYLTDRRDDWIIGRGGYLNYGLLNPSAKPVPTPAQQAAAPVAPIANSKLIEFCLLAMGGAYTIHSPDTYDAIPPVQDLKWFGSSAPIELDKLLETVNATLAIDLGGDVHIWPLGLSPHGGLEIPTDRLIWSGDVRGDNRSADMIVFTSAPNRVKKTQTLAVSDSGSFEYVVRDLLNASLRTQAWYKIDESPRLQNISASAAHLIQNRFRSDYANLGDHTEYRDKLYYSIRLSQQFADPMQCPILTKVYEKDGSATEITVTGTIARQHANGAWYNSPNETIPVMTLSHGAADQGNVLTLADRLGGIDHDGNPDRDAGFVVAADVEVRFTIEDVVEGDAQNPSRPKYYAVGFRFENKSLTVVPSDGTGFVPGMETAYIVSMPQWNPVAVDGQALDATDFIAEASARASKYFAAKSAGSHKDVVEGFWLTDLDGGLQQAEYDQERGTTTFISNGFFRPTGGFYYPKGSQDTGASFPGESPQQSTRMADGMAGAVPTGVFLNPRVPEVAPPASLYALLTAKATGGGEYNGLALTGSLDGLDPATDLALPAGLVQGQAVVVVNPEEKSQPTHWLALNTVIRCDWDGGLAKDKTPIVVVSGPGIYVIDNPSSLGSAAEGSTTPDGASWDRGRKTSGQSLGDCALALSFVSRVVYDHTAETPQLIQMFRTATYDSAGNLKDVSVETPVVVDEPEDCDS